MARQQEEQTLNAVVTPSELLAMQAAVERVVVDESVGRYCVALTAATRTHSDVLMEPSPRGALGLLLCSRAYAIIDGRDFVTPEDVKAVARPVLAHRVTVKPELWMSDVSGSNVVTAPPVRADPGADPAGAARCGEPDGHHGQSRGLTCRSCCPGRRPLAHSASGPRRRRTCGP